MGVDGRELLPSEYSGITAEQKNTLKLRVKRHLSDSEPIRVLSLVGGGIRGFMLGKVLEEIERVTGKRIAQLFDCIVGTSTGVPIAFALSYPKEVTVEDVISDPGLSEPHLASHKFPAEMITKIYSNYGPYIFANSALKRVLDPIIKDKIDGLTLFSEAELSEVIDQEGFLIRNMALQVNNAQNISEAYNELERKINRSKAILDNIFLTNLGD